MKVKQMVPGGIRELLLNSLMLVMYPSVQNSLGFLRANRTNSI